MAKGHAWHAAGFLAQPVCHGVADSASSQASTALADDPHGARIRGHDLVIHDSHGQWSRRQCDLAAVSGAGVVLLLGWLLLKELPTRADWVMFAFCAGGVGLIVAMEAIYGSLYATMLGVLSGITYAIVILCLRSMRGVDSVWLIALNHGGSALLLLPWVMQNTHQVPTTSYVALAMFGLFQMSLAYILFARGLRTTGAAEASLLSLIEPLLLPVWVYIAWRHHPLYIAPAVWTWIGGSLILVGLVCRYLPAVIWRSDKN